MARAPAAPPRRRSIGIAGRLLLLTVGFVLLAMGLFYASRLTAYRENWLRDRLMVAHTAMMLFGETGEEPAPPELADKILDTVNAKSIVVTLPDGRRLVAEPDRPPAAVVETDEIGDSSSIDALLAQAAFRTLFAAARIAGAGDRAVAGRRRDDRRHARRIAADRGDVADFAAHFLVLSLIISAVVTCVLWAALWSLVIRPVRRLTSSIIAFGERPQDSARVIAPSGRDDEIGRAEAALATMQGSLAHELSQRKRLAELGMAVARINHDLRNMLSAAQLISDRLAHPRPARPAPRAAAGGDARPRDPVLPVDAHLRRRTRAAPPRRFDLRELVRQVVETAEAERRRGDRLRDRHPAEFRAPRRPRPRPAGDREPLPQRRAGAAHQRRAEWSADRDPPRGDPHRQASR